jgi:hypothetical protein
MARIIHVYLSTCKHIYKWVQDLESGYSYWTEMYELMKIMYFDV